MRARRGRIVGWLVVLGYLGLCAVAAITALDGDVARGGRPAADAFIAAWERSRTGTYVVEAGFERRAPATGDELRSTVVVAQRPPTRVIRAFSGTTGRVEDRTLTCGARPDVDDPPCILGAPGRTFEESVAAEVATLEDYLLGSDPLYVVLDERNGCFLLRRTRYQPLASYGLRARLCFDDATGAARSTEVSHDNGVVETTVARSIRAQVRDADLEY